MTSETGGAGREANEGIRELWETADRLNKSRPGKGTWVAWREVEIREELLPRERLDEEAVRCYEPIMDQLPPIKFQRETLILIDGRHRLAAAPRFNDHIPSR